MKKGWESSQMRKKMKNIRWEDLGKSKEKKIKKKIGNKKLIRMEIERTRQGEIQERGRKITKKKQKERRDEARVEKTKKEEREEKVKNAQKSEDHQLEDLGHL